MSDWIQERVHRGNVTLVCRHRPGPTPTVVFLHGLAGYGGEFEPSADALAGRHGVLLLDQRGHGESTRRPSSVSRTDYRDDVIRVVEELCPAGCALVGQSLGGHTAVLVAAHRPDLVHRLIVVEAHPGRAAADLPDKCAAWFAGWPRRFGSPAAAAAFFDEQGIDGAAWSAGLEPRDQGWAAAFDADVLVRAISTLCEQEAWEEWRGVRCPTLVVTGENGTQPEEDVRRMLDTNPRATRAVVAGAGHDVHLDRPQDWYRLLRDFLDADPGR